MSNSIYKVGQVALTRNRIAQAIDGLLMLLDKMDCDADLEDSGDDEYYLADAVTDRECDISDSEPSMSAGTADWSTQGGHGSELDYEASEPIDGGQAL